MVRHKVKPGITGWAQVNGHRGETDTVEKMRARVEYDLQYLRNWSLGLDLKIIVGRSGCSSSTGTPTSHARVVLVPPNGYATTVDRTSRGNAGNASLRKICHERKPLRSLNC